MDRQRLVDWLREADEARCRQHVNGSTAIATALVEEIGPMGGSVWRRTGKPVPAGAPPFGDVGWPAGSPYDLGCLWNGQLSYDDSHGVGITTRRCLAWLSSMYRMQERTSCGVDLKTWQESALKTG
jgi:hypothetical protein